MKTLTLIPTLNPHPKFTNGKIDEIGAGSIEYQYAVKCITSFSVSEYIWGLDCNDRVILGTSPTVNIPMNIESNDFKKPENGFKAKGAAHSGGVINHAVAVEGETYNLELTTEQLIKYKDNLEALAVEYEIGKEVEPEEPEPETPEPAPSGEYVPQVGDIVLSSGKGLLSRALRLLHAIRNNIPVKEVWGHIEYFISKKILFSAEGKGLMDVPWEERKKSILRGVAYRWKKGIPEDFKRKLLEITEKELRGRGYGYSRWILNGLTLACFFLALVGLFGLPFSITFSKWMGVIFLVLMFPVRWYLKKKDVLTFDCIETFSYAFQKLGMYVPMIRPRDDTPNNADHVFKNLELARWMEKVWEFKKGDN